MRGLQGVARIMSDGFEKATADVQTVVNESLAGVIRSDIRFIEGASSTLVKWVRAVQPAIDSLDRPVDMQGRLRREARRHARPATERGPSGRDADSPGNPEPLRRGRGRRPQPRSLTRDHSSVLRSRPGSNREGYH